MRPLQSFGADNFPQNKKAFQDSLDVGQQLIAKNPKQIIFLGEQPTFANYNVGWIELGKKTHEENNIQAFERKQFKYRPDLKTAEEWFKDPNFVWNTGYFITTANFILEEYEKQKPEMYNQLITIQKALGTKKENEVLQKVYPEIEATHFDNVVLENLDNDKSVVLKTNFQWSDPGTLYALKEFLQDKPQSNVTKGFVYDYMTKDSLIYNFVKNQIVTTVGLEGFIVINTPDAVLVCHKDQVGDIKNMLKEWESTELEKLL
jgi:mannose-1-phosphate guanylyltransferase